MTETINQPTLAEHIIDILDDLHYAHDLPDKTDADRRYRSNLEASCKSVLARAMYDARAQLDSDSAFNAVLNAEVHGRSGYFLDHHVRAVLVDVGRRLRENEREAEAIESHLSTILN